MKRENTKHRKRQPAAEKKPSKPVCGTLFHLAECRGAVQRSGFTLRPGAGGIPNRFER